MDLSQANRLAEMALDMTEQPDLVHTVDRIVSNAQHSIACDAVSLLLVRDGTFEQGQASDPVIEQLDAYQIEVRQGPTWSPEVCWDTRVINDLATETAWPTWCARASDLDVHSVLSVRLFTPVRTLGALNLYAKRRSAFSAEDEELAQIFGRHASIALMGAQSSDTLRAAVTSRHVIGQAQGILMERYQVDSERAFTVLRRYSQERNIKLRLIAEQVIATHRLPE